VREVRGIIDMFKQRHGMVGRNRDFEDAEPDEAPTPVQPAQAPLKF
jgi:hypothetical protein